MDRIEGNTQPGFGRVADAFSKGAMAGALGPGGGAFAAYVDGRLVADLWAGNAAPGRPWQEDTLAILMSSTKGMAALCAQILADRGQLDVDAPVCTYWPEFAANGKDGVLVRHVLTHTAGVVGFGDGRPPLGWDGAGWDDADAIAAALAAAPAWWAPGEKFGYHALTFGWLIGELVRRITGTTVGTMFRTEVAEPLGLDLRIGTPPADQRRVAVVMDGTLASVPRFLRPILGSVQRQMRDPATLAGQAFVATDGSSLMDHAETFFADSRALSAEIPAGNGTGTARAIGKMYAALACGGELDGVRLMSEESVRRFGAEAISLPDAMLAEMRPRLLWTRLMGRPVRRSLGYLINPSMPREPLRFGPNPHAFGHDGAGGQIAFCDPDRGVAVGFVRNYMTSSSRFSTALINTMYDCAGRTTVAPVAGS
ncbi:MAG TPA: serine hydrolase domain-containing protein [Acidimicrobiales bacterium]|nr:serine hydrolase domain-containing protein [Acidimicrobiales bacterium]